MELAGFPGAYLNCYSDCHTPQINRFSFRSPPQRYDPVSAASYDGSTSTIHNRIIRGRNHHGG